MIRIIFVLICSFFWIGSTFASTLPFTDVASTAPYHDSVKTLYDGGIITNNGDNLFRPNEQMTRDFYVSLVVGIGCKKCEPPSVEDIVKYINTPFVDVSKNNQYYYCIAYAEDVGIAQGYIPDTTGKITCENNTSYSTSPFCASNTISRIEAAAVLLRRANLWNDTLNSANTDKSIAINDVTQYWYGYAKKGIEVGIISLKNDGKIGQNDKITR